jgi:hypothetical protein
MMANIMPLTSKQTLSENIYFLTYSLNHAQLDQVSQGHATTQQSDTTSLSDIPDADFERMAEWYTQNIFRASYCD